MQWYKIGLLVPEIFVLLGIIIPSTRTWVKGLIEDSDGDPHHRDGFFLVIVWASKWCFCMAFLSGYEHIYHGKELLQVTVTFLVSGAALIGVRLFKNKLNLSLPYTKDTKETKE